MRRTAAVSTRVYRMIRRRSGGKLGAISVLPVAAELWAAGETLWRHNNAARPEFFVPKI